MDDQDSPPDTATPVDAASNGSDASASALSGEPPRLPSIFPPTVGRPNHLPPIASLASLADQSQFAANETLDSGLRRLLLLQALAAQQQQILQALGSLPGGISANISALAPTPPATPLGLSPQTLSSHFPLPPAAGAYQHQQEAPWTSNIDGLNSLYTRSSSTDEGDGRRRPSVSAPSASTSTSALHSQELEQAQAQLDAWSQMVFTSGAPSSLPTGLPAPIPTFAPAAFDWTGTLYSQQSTVVSPASTTMSAENSASPTGRTRSVSVTKGGKSRAKVEVEEDVEEEEVEEDKRRRNTAASARFRAKKKQRDAELQQTSAQLRERLADLEKQASSLKAENQWLRDLISEKTEPKLHTS